MDSWWLGKSATMETSRMVMDAQLSVRSKLQKAGAVKEDLRAPVLDALPVEMGSDK
jgi:hypothetical protein